MHRKLVKTIFVYNVGCWIKLINYTQFRLLVFYNVVLFSFLVYLAIRVWVQIQEIDVKCNFFVIINDYHMISSKKIRLLMSSSGHRSLVGRSILFCWRSIVSTMREDHNATMLHFLKSRGSNLTWLGFCFGLLFQNITTKVNKLCMQSLEKVGQFLEVQ